MKKTTTDKIPPQALEIEEAVLGGLIIDSDYRDEVMQFMCAEYFYKTIHATIFKAIAFLYNCQEPIDILTISNRLKETSEIDSIGGIMTLSMLTNNIASSANILQHCRIIQQNWFARKLIEISHTTTNRAYTEDPFDVYDETVKKLEEANIQLTGGKECITLPELVYDSIKRAETRYKLSQNSAVLGVTTGFSDMDKLTNGWQDTDLIILAARPGMGKTALTLALAKNAAKAGNPVYFKSIEMSAKQLTDRLILGECYPDEYIFNEEFSRRFKRGTLRQEDWDVINTAAGKINDLPIYIDDHSSCTHLQFRAELRLAKKKYGIRLAIIDYLQLMKMIYNTKQQSKEQVMAETTCSLKLTAKELEIPIICISQLSREVEKRGGDKKPILADLRDSGAIEADADLVLFLYRACYYNANAEDSQGNSLKNIIETIFAKHRNGNVGSVFLNHNDTISKFYDFSGNSYNY